MTSSVIFIDSRVADYQTLIAGLTEGTEWFLLNAEEDGVDQMARILANYASLDSVQVISHGSAGTLYIGNTVLNSENITSYESQLQVIGASLTETGDILLYGCNVGAGETGMQFIGSLAQATGADVAASADITGMSTLGGNWVLELSSGIIETQGLKLDGYPAVLDGAFLEGENNDSQLQATLLPLAEDPAGSGLAVGFGVGRQDPAVYQNTWSDPDWWRVELQAGDLVSVSVDTPASNVDSYVELYNAAGQQLTGNDDSGPDADAFISHYAVTESGSYYVRVGKGYYSSESGDYALRVERARGIQLESDASYQNDAISGANALALTQAGTHQTATVAGTVMAPSGSNLDEDVFALGVFNTGNVVELNTRLPGTSTLVPKVTLLDAAGQVIADSDGNPGDGHVLATLAGDGAIYARVESGIWEHGGHRYVLTDGAMTWTAAEAYAQTLGGHLVTVDDAAEQAWLTSNFGGMSPWIGFTDQAVEGTWVWFERDGGGLHQLGQQRAQHVLLLL